MEWHCYEVKALPKLELQIKRKNGVSETHFQPFLPKCDQIICFANCKKIFALKKLNCKLHVNHITSIVKCSCKMKLYSGISEQILLS